MGVGSACLFTVSLQSNLQLVGLQYSPQRAVHANTHLCKSAQIVNPAPPPFPFPPLASTRFAYHFAIAIATPAGTQRRGRVLRRLARPLRRLLGSMHAMWVHDVDCRMRRSTTPQGFHLRRREGQGHCQRASNRLTVVTHRPCQKKGRMPCVQRMHTCPLRSGGAFSSSHTCGHCVLSEKSHPGMPGW